MQDQPQKPTVTVDGTVYELESLTPQVRNMIAMYQKWSTQLSDLQSEYAKTDLAVKSLGAEIGKQIAATDGSAPPADPAPAEEKPSKKRK